MLAFNFCSRSDPCWHHRFVRERVAVRHVYGVCPQGVCWAGRDQTRSLCHGGAAG
jgi:hypothetical protein